MPHLIQLLMIVTFVISGSVLPPPASALNQILNVRHWVAPDHTRVVIDMSDDVPFTVEKGERKISVTVDDSALPSHMPTRIQIRKPGLDEVSMYRKGPAGVCVELTTPDQVQTTVFKLKQFQDKPFRIVIDIVLPDIARQQTEAREQIKITRKNRIIVIDPGHGGEAVGAVGSGGTLEKEVVLLISRKLRDILNRKSGYNAFLTREGDYYVSFQKRLMIAREYGADIFVSIHADAARNRTAAGSSVYCFSTGGASSEAARILARTENLADVIGGVPNTEGRDASDPIILDMFQTHAINQSRTFGGALLHYLAGANRLKFVTVQEAQFLVLKLPDIPSILIETAYISNPKEEKLLRNSRFQTQIAESIARSIIEFLPPLPAVAISASTGGKASQGKTSQVKGDIGTGKKTPGREVQAADTVTDRPSAPGNAKTKSSVREKSSLYRVKKGDTLQGIAREHGTTVETLRSLNRMSSHDPLPANRMLKIAGNPPAGVREKKQAGSGKRSPGKKPGPVVYRVKRGDTLSAIARMHGTTVRVIVDLNHLKPNTPLFVGRKLFLPENPSL